MASGSGSRLRADADPYMPESMPAWVSELLDDPPMEEVARGGYTPLLLPPDENASRAFVKKFISGHLSKVSKEVDQSLVDYVNAFDPSQVAAQVEALLFERWGLFDLSKPVSGKYSLFLSRLGHDGIKDLRRHILLGEITQGELANMSIIESAGVREASVHALKCLYEVDDNVPTLGLFTKRFSSQMIALAGNIDTSVAIPASGLVKQLLRHQKSNISQPGAEAEHGTINLGYIWGDYICLGVDSRLTCGLTKRTTSLTYNKFFRLGRNVYLSIAGLRSGWEEMCRWLKVMASEKSKLISYYLKNIYTDFLLTLRQLSNLPEEDHRVEMAARLAYQFPSAGGPVSSLVVGWDTNSPNP